MATKKRSQWVDVKTEHGLPADQIISALQKEIRRGHTENAVLLAYEMILTSPALEDYLWQRLMIIAVEDIGLGEPQAPLLLQALAQMARTFDRDVGERQLFAVHAVRYLCRCQKDRSSDEMLNWVQHAVASGTARPSIPDYALDMHTAQGRALGRGRRHFYEEGAQLAPEWPERDRTYRRRIMEMLDQDEGNS
ncbi:MAG: AAA family ATPase [Chloroflexi bacterium]|nr:AAA family ATPase [Chloroflexota bacterium]MBU1751205.1 AAA family ATPase [Chloroflexota bacterium]